MRLPTTRSLILRFLPPIARSFSRRLSPRSRLLREDPLQPLRRRLRRPFEIRLARSFAAIESRLAPLVERRPG